MSVHPLLRQAMASAVVRKYPMALVVLVAVIDAGMSPDVIQPIKIDALVLTLGASGKHSVRRGLRWLVACGYLVEHVPACASGKPGRYSLANRGHDNPGSGTRSVPPLADVA